MDLSVTFFENYLNSRKQKVILNNKKLDIILKTEGVSQGSILGPVLFSLYIASFVKIINHCFAQSYADYF